MYTSTTVVDVRQLIIVTLIGLIRLTWAAAEKGVQVQVQVQPAVDSNNRPVNCLLYPITDDLLTNSIEMDKLLDRFDDVNYYGGNNDPKEDGELFFAQAESGDLTNSDEEYPIYLCRRKINSFTLESKIGSSSPYLKPKPKERVPVFKKFPPQPTRPKEITQAQAVKHSTEIAHSPPAKHSMEIAHPGKQSLEIPDPKQAQGFLRNPFRRHPFIRNLRKMRQRLSQRKPKPSPPPQAPSNLKTDLTQSGSEQMQFVFHDLRNIRQEMESHSKQTPPPNHSTEMKYPTQKVPASERRPLEAFNGYQKVPERQRKPSAGYNEYISPQKYVPNPNYSEEVKYVKPKVPERQRQPPVESHEHIHPPKYEPEPQKSTYSEYSYPISHNSVEISSSTEESHGNGNGGHGSETGGHGNKEVSNPAHKFLAASILAVIVSGIGVLFFTIVAYMGLIVQAKVPRRREEEEESSSEKEEEIEEKLDVEKIRKGITNIHFHLNEKEEKAAEKKKRKEKEEKKEKAAEIMEFIREIIAVDAYAHHLGAANLGLVAQQLEPEANTPEDRRRHTLPGTATATGTGTGVQTANRLKNTQSAAHTLHNSEPITHLKNPESSVTTFNNPASINNANSPNLASTFHNTGTLVVDNLKDTEPVDIFNSPHSAVTYNDQELAEKIIQNPTPTTTTTTPAPKKNIVFSVGFQPAISEARRRPNSKKLRNTEMSR